MKLDRCLEDCEIIFFDFDGVLVDSVPIKTKAYQEIFRPYGEKAVHIITEYHMANGGIDRYQKVEYVLNQIGESLDKKEILAEQFGNMVKDLVITSKPVTGMIEVVENLFQKNIPLYIVSGTPQTELREIVEKRGWKRYFAGVFGSPLSKIEIVDMIMKENHYDPSKSVFIGDAMTDYKTALRHKLWYIGVPVL